MNKKLLIAGLTTATAALSLVTIPLPAHSQSAQEGIQALKAQSRAFVEISKNILPAVVSITSNRIVNPASDNGMLNDPFFHRFFDQNVPEEFNQQGSGSGVVVSHDGYILTNNHVIAEADELEVTLYDGRTFQAELVGRDPQSDVAVIKIDADELHPAALGDSDGLEVGEWVLAAGNPFQLTSSITSGIVSAIGRQNIGLARYENFIQTDAAINPGNSGGALVNLDGEVIGVNTAIASRSGGYQGIGFAIPINQASDIMEQLISDGKVTRGYLGVQIGSLDEVMADYYGLDEAKGALVDNVTEDSAADKAGVEQGDVIVGVNGEKIDNMRDLQMTIAGYRPGTKIDLEVVRDGRYKNLVVELGELDLGEGNESEAAPLDTHDEEISDLGLELEDLTRRVRREYEIETESEGVLITKVSPLSVADKANFRLGDIILEMDKKPVDSVEVLADRLAGLEPGSPVLFLVERPGAGEIHLAIRLPN